MGIRRPKYWRRWLVALAFSLGVHLLVLGVAMHQQQRSHRQYAGGMTVTLMRPHVPPPPPEPKPQKIAKEPPPKPTVQARQVESPIIAAPSPAPAASAARPPEQAAVAGPPPPSIPRALKLGCTGQDFERMTPAQRGECVAELTAFPRSPKGGTPIPPNAHEAAIAQQGAEKDARNAPMRASVPPQTNCLEATLGGRCIADTQSVTIIDKKF